MKTNVIIIDDFYEDPDAVREFALNQEYPVKGNYPGDRTKDFRTDEMKQMFEQITGKKITYWDMQYNGCFQYTTKDMKSWIHHDCTHWAAIIYLTPDAPASGGTAYFRHKETGVSRLNEPGFTPEQWKKAAKECGDMSKWEIVDQVGNKYNRLAMFRGDRYHRSMTYWGDSKENGRLFQLFFFNVAE